MTTPTSKGMDQMAANYFDVWAAASFVVSNLCDSLAVFGVSFALFCVSSIAAWYQRRELRNGGAA